MMRREGGAAVAGLALLCVLGVISAHGAEPRETIKSQKYEVQAVPYRDESREDPFVPRVPLKAVQSRDKWKVRIGGLRLSSVMSGKKRVALFTELYGPSFSYILVNSVLIGPDHRPIPGIAGSIEPLGTSGNYRVTLQQGTERVEHTFVKLDEEVRRRAAELRMQKERERQVRAGGDDGTRNQDGNPSTRGGDR